MTETPPTHRPRRWLKILLVVSLGLNLMVAGLVVGAMVTGGDRGEGRSDRREAGFGPLTRALNSDDRRKLGREIRQATRGQSNTAKSDWSGVLSALRTDPFEADALRQLFATQRGNGANRMEIAQETMVAHIVKMGSDERRDFADRLEDALAKPPRPKNQ